MKFYNLCIFFIASSILLFENAFGCWAEMPLKKITSDSPLIIIGSIEKIKQADPPKKNIDYQYDIAYINVSEVLKNTLQDYEVQNNDEVPLSMPSALNLVVNSTDIRYKKGTSGIWILDFKKNTFWATYPKDYQPMSKEKEMREILENLEKETKKEF